MREYFYRFPRLPICLNPIRSDAHGQNRKNKLRSEQNVPETPLKTFHWKPTETQAKPGFEEIRSKSELVGSLRALQEIKYLCASAAIGFPGFQLVRMTFLEICMTKIKEISSGDKKMCRNPLSKL